MTWSGTFGVRASEPPCYASMNSGLRLACIMQVGWICYVLKSDADGSVSAGVGTILAVANRTEARDFIDLASLMSHSSIRRLFELACRK